MSDLLLAVGIFLAAHMIPAIRPVRAGTCYQCHSQRAKKVKAHLHLDSRDGLFAGGDNGPVVVAGDPAKSPLIIAIGYLDNDLQMPPRKKLPGAVVADFTEWIKMGAPWPADAAPGTGTGAGTPEAPSLPGGMATFRLWRNLSTAWGTEESEEIPEKPSPDV